MLGFFPYFCSAMTPIDKIQIGQTTVLATAIPAASGDERLTRRQREKEAVQRLQQAFPGGMQIGHAADGAPVIAEGYVSVTHSQRVAAVAVDPSRAIGIDAEEWRDALRRVGDKFLSPTEREWITADADLLLAWTIKEAVYKAAATPKPALTEIECLPGMRRAVTSRQQFALESWMMGDTQFTLAYVD